MPSYILLGEEHQAHQLTVKPSEAQRRTAVAQQTVDRIAHQLLYQSKAAAVSAEKDGEKQTGRDILSLLVHANTDKALPDAQRLSDEDVCARRSIQSISAE